MSTPEPDRPRAKEVIEALIEALHKGTEDFYSVSYVPGTYEVYLHPNALAEFQGSMLDLFRPEAELALQDTLDKLNEKHPIKRVKKAASFFQRLRQSKLMTKAVELASEQEPAIRYRRAGYAWEISLHAAHDAKSIDYLKVIAELAAPEQQRLDQKKATRRITVRNRDGTYKTSMAPAGEPPPQPPPTRPVSKATQRSEEPQRPEEPQRSEEPQPGPPDDTLAGKPLARLTFTDEEGPQSYIMDRPEILIGRSDPEYPHVDLKLNTLTDVSREHLRLRYDATKKAFFVADLSSLGAHLDGRALPNDEKIWTPVPDTATFKLAGVNLYINFERLI